MACCCRSRCWPRRVSAASMCMRRCCRAGAARRRSSARSWPATPRPASRSCRWMRGSTPARSCCNRRSRSARRKPPEQLGDRLAALGAGLIVEALDGLARGIIEPRPQPGEGATYAAKLRRDEARLDWRRPAAELERQVRAFDPWPGAWFEGRGERLRVLAAEADPQPAPAASRHRARRAPVDRLRRRRVPAAPLAARRPRAARHTSLSARFRAAARDGIAVPRYKLTIEYCGAGFVGWQRQAERAVDPGGAGNGGAPLLRREQ